MKFSYLKIILTSFLLPFSLIACKKSITVPSPITQLVTASVFENDATATSALTVIYQKMFNNEESFLISQANGLLADELTNYSNNLGQMQYYSNSMTANVAPGSSTPGPWANAYNYIYQANAIIEGLQKYQGVSSAAKEQLIGESRFIRAFWYFYLVNLYGDVPLVVSTDYTINANAFRASSIQIYKQIVNDLNESESELNNNYVDATDTAETFDRVRPTKGAARALLARTYLFTNDFMNAEAQASLVIENTSLYNLCNNLDSVFLTNSAEAIWQIATPLPNNFNTLDGRLFILKAAPSTGTINSNTISQQLMQSFEVNDNRKSRWIASYTSSSSGMTYSFPYKYKVYQSNLVTEYQMVLRLAEQYLIRAEARIKLGKIDQGVMDINTIRNRAGLANYNGPLDTQSLLNEILHQRQVELFTEWGNRWFDLIRTGSVNSVMSVITPLKGGTWKSDGSQLLYPIPQSERNTDANLTQNPGY